ncbi:thioredoxin family protein [Nocardioides caldifontis]|uniref:thioredoxin family protein n=1 Tax=Nocardioides caldifontis TaxID=2588938 RepID=UPI001EF03001|nr:thioredoxin family protein [Nocardioides caldifontis]
MVRVELLYFGGCPHWQVADDRLSQALAELGGADVVVSRRLVETPEQAEELAFLESPTIRIDGTHPFATGDEIVELTCRVYATPSGLSGSPHTALLLEVLS